MFSVQMFMLKSWNLFWHTNIFSSTTSHDEYVVCAVLKDLTQRYCRPSCQPPCYVCPPCCTFAKPRLSALTRPVSGTSCMNAGVILWCQSVRVWDKTSPLHLFSLRRKFRLRMPLQQCMDRVQAWTKVLDNAFHKRADKFCTPVSLWCSWCTQGVMSRRDVIQKWEQACVFRTFGSIVEGVMLLICWWYHTGTSGHIAV